MAINPETEYPGQIAAADAAYPFGAARNDTVPDDGLGTPLEAKWMNDFFGFGAAILSDAAVSSVPNGTPEQVGASQYLDGLKAIVTAALTARDQARYPVGEIFITQRNVNPSAILGFGTWARTAAGRVLVGYNAADSDFNAAKKLSGAKTHTLTTSEMPSHTHTTNITLGTNEGTTGSPPNLQTSDDTTGTGGYVSQSAGSGAAHNNVQPSYTVYFWERTA